MNAAQWEIGKPGGEGSVRGRQQRRGDVERHEVVPILIHGDAAFAGQGVVTETFQMSQTNGFKTGGTVHIVINNQIGFTMSRPSDARSTHYCSDVAKMIEAPIVHVNGDDPEGAFFVTRLALEYRQYFKKDVVIDLVCYRRHGHNEADEPSATQPVMYAKIREKKTTRHLYADRLIAAGLIDAAGVSRLQDEYRDRIDRGEPVPKLSLGMIGNEYTVDWSPYINATWDESVDTTLSPDKLKELAQKITHIPAWMTLHGRGQRVMPERARVSAVWRARCLGFSEATADGGPRRGDADLVNRAAGGSGDQARRGKRRMAALARPHAHGREALDELDFVVAFGDRVEDVLDLQVLVEIDEVHAPRVGCDGMGAYSCCRWGRQGHGLGHATDAECLHGPPRGAASVDERRLQRQRAINRAGQMQMAP